MFYLGCSTRRTARKSRDRTCLHIEVAKVFNCSFAQRSNAPKETIYE